MMYSINHNVDYKMMYSINLNVDYKMYCARRVSGITIIRYVTGITIIRYVTGITIIRYAQYRNIRKPNNFKVFGSNKSK